MKVVNSVPAIRTSMPLSFTSSTSQVTTAPFLTSPGSANGSPSSCLTPSEMRSFSTSTSSTTALTMSPFLKLSITCSPGSFQSRSDRCTMPSTSPSSPRNRPNSVLFLTSPSTTEPEGYFSTNSSHGLGRVCLSPSEMRRLTGSTSSTSTSTSCEVETILPGWTFFLVHVSEMSWTKKNGHPGKIVSTSQEVEVQVLEVDPVKRRISLGLKQTMRNPWEVFLEKYPPGSEVEGEVKNKTEFGLFLGLDGDVDGMVHLSDLDWKRPGEQVIEEFKKGDKVRAKVLDVDVEKERISLGVKQLEGDPMETAGDIKKGSVVTCEVTEVKESGLDVKIVGSDLTTFIKRSELARDRGEQRPERFAVGQKVDARVIQIDRRTQKVQVSIKALEVAEEKEAIAQYGSTDSGATLGDILGTALKRVTDKPDEKEE